MGETDTPSERGELAVQRRWSLGNWLVIAVFVVLTVVGVAITAGLFGEALVDRLGTTTDGGVGVPLAVYLYATLGALGYVFTRLMTTLEEFDEWGELEKLAEMGLRIPAAWVLAAGVYLLGSVAVGTAGVTNSQLITGVPFLVGLYVNVAFKALGGVADRLLGRGAPRRQEDESERSTD